MPTEGSELSPLMLAGVCGSWPAAVLALDAVPETEDVGKRGEVGLAG